MSKIIRPAIGLRVSVPSAIATAGVPTAITAIWASHCVFPVTIARIAAGSKAAQATSTAAINSAIIRGRRSDPIVACN